MYSGSTCWLKVLMGKYAATKKNKTTSCTCRRGRSQPAPTTGASSGGSSSNLRQRRSKEKAQTQALLVMQVTQPAHSPCGCNTNLEESQGFCSNNISWKHQPVLGQHSTLQKHWLNSLTTSLHTEERCVAVPVDRCGITLLFAWQSMGPWSNRQGRS